MIRCRLFLILITAILFISALHAERARYDNLQDDENFLNTNDNEDVIETVKRLLFKSKKTTTSKPSTDAIAALITTTPHNRFATSSVKDACGAGNPCQNGGTCRTLASGRHYCYCTDQYYGRNCEKKFKSTGYNTDSRTNKDHCTSSPCRNAGECVPLRTTFYCRCKTPYYGTSCDKRLSKREESIEESNSSEQNLRRYD